MTNATATGLNGIICERCGYKIFVPISAPQGMVITLKNNDFVCPRCQHITQTGDGVYVATATVFERITSVVPSRDELDALIRVLSSSAAQESPETARAAAEEAAPSLAPYLTDYFGLDVAKWRELLPAILFALGWLWVFLKMPSHATGMKAFESLFSAAKVALGKHDDGVTPGKAAEAGKAAAEAANVAARREKNAKKRARKERR